jgi:RNA polymerase sigma-70 factor (ECF subfamily)
MSEALDPPGAAAPLRWWSAARARLGRATGASPGGEDWALWRRACAGEAAAATALVRQLTPQALGLARQLLRRQEDAEDMVQESFLRLWGSRPSEARGASLATFFNTIVINRCKSLLLQRRELSLEPEALDALSEALIDTQRPTPEGALELRIEGRALLQALQRLPARQRMALALWAYADASVAEIAQALSLSEANAAHQLLHRA